MYFPQIFANAGNSRNIDQTWKRKEPQRGLVLPHEYPRGAVFQPQRFWSKKIKNEKDEKTRRFFARFRCSKIISLSNNQFFKAAKRVTDAVQFPKERTELCHTANTSILMDKQLNTPLPNWGNFLKMPQHWHPCRAVIYMLTNVTMQKTKNSVGIFTRKCRKKP